MDSSLSMRDEDTALRERVGALQAENARLREESERHRGLFSAMDEGFALLEVILGEAGQPTDLRHLEVNDAFAGLIDRRPEAVIGRTTRELLPAISPWWVETLAQVALTGDPARFARYGEVTRRHYDVHAWSPKPGLCAALFRDVTEQREAKQALRESEERLRVALEGGRLGTWDLDLVNDIAVRSPRHDEIWGYSEPQSEWGLEIAMRHVVPEDRQLIMEAYDRGIKTGWLSHENRIVWPDGSIRWIAANGRFQYDDAGRPIRVVGVVADITERKQSEVQLRTTLESIGDGFIACDAEWRFVYINAAAERLLGMRREDIIDKSFWGVFPLTIGTRLEREYRRAADGEPVDFDNYYTPWGRWFHNRCFPREGGGLSVYFQDITERKLAEEALRRSEQRFRELADAMPQLVWTARPDGTVDYYNRRYREFAAITRFPSDTTPQGELWEWVPVLHPDDLEPTVEAWQRALATGTVYEIEHRVRRADGSYRWYLSRGVPARDAEGHITKWYGTATDIHATKMAERALRESEQRFREVLENSRDMVYRRNMRTGEYDYISPSAERVHGYTADETLAMSVEEVIAHVHPDDVAGFYARDAALLESPEERPTNTSEYRWRSKSGEYVWLSASRTLIRDAEGQPLAHVGTIRDVTDAKRAQQEREELLRRVEAERATLEAVLEQMPSGVMIAEAPSGRIMLANRRMQEVAGWTALPGNAFEERSHWQGFHSDGRPYGAEEWPLARSLRHGDVVRDEEIAIVRADGTRGAISASGAPVRDSEGRIIAGVVIDLDITRRKEIESALESTARFPKENPEPILRVARDGTLLFANAASAPVLSEWGCWTGEGVPSAWHNLVTVALDEGRGSVVDLTVGPTVYSLYIVPIAGTGYANIYGADVTAERKAMAALQESEQRFRTLADNMSQFAWMADENGWLFWYNRRWYEYTGTTLEEMEGWGWQKAHHPDHVDRVVTKVAECFRTGQVWEDTFPLRGKDGGYRWFLSRAIPIRDEAGRVLRWFGTNTDITELREAEQSARENEQRFRSVLENSRDVIYRIDLRTNHYDYLSPSVEGLTGYTEQEVQAMPRAWAHERIHPEDRQRFLAGIDALRDLPPGERSGVVEYRWLYRDGGYRWISNVRTLLTDADDQPLALVGTLRDVTESKAFEQQLWELNVTLESRVVERTRQLRALAAELTMAEEHERRRLARYLHDDLQQILAAVTFHLDRVHERNLARGGDGDLQEPIDMLREAIQTSRSLTAELSPTILYESGLAVALHWLGRRMKQQHGLHVAVEAPEPAGAPPISDDVKVFLYQSARELLFNVVKHAGADEATVRIARPTPETVEVVVADDGRGFDMRRRIGRQRFSSGFGLLSITERLEYVGGSARIESAPGRGTRVTLTAPLQPLSSPREASNGAEGVTRAEAVEAVATESRIRILVADDHAIVRKGLLRLLEDQPDLLVVGEAGDGREALELARQLHPDVVLMDLAMPNMDGIEATQRITAEMAGIRVIGLSMYDDEEKERLMRDAGAKGYIPKGDPPGALFAAIRGDQHD